MGKPTKMDVEHLIECVRKHEFLYDMSHNDYKNVARKLSAWESIGREVNQTGEVAKTKWKSIRAGYTRYKKDLKGTTGSKRKYITYVWSSQLSFLDNYNVTRLADSSVLEVPPSPLRVKTPSHDESSNPWSNPSTPSPIPFKTSPPDSLEFVLSTSDTPEASSHNAQSTRSNTSSRIKRKKIDDDTDTLTQKEGHDGIDYLFLSYADTFRKFPTREQALLKLELAKLFTSTELRLLNNSDDSKPLQT